MKHFIFFAALMCLFSVSLVHGQKPNIVIFMSDDQGWADVGWHGTEVKTPRLDQLAASGMRLERFYVAPVCSPTRAGLMTGRYPMRYGLQVAVVWPWADYGLSLDERTLAEALREAGYFTAICGKWHLGEKRREFLPNQRGFDHHYGHYLGEIDYYTHKREGGLDWHRNGKPLEEKGYATDLIADESVRLIQNHDTKKPLFLYVPFLAPHSPFQETPHKELNAQYDHLKNPRRTYAGMVSAMDAAIGHVLDALEEKGMKENTLLFFCSDNGGTNPGTVSDNGPLRAGKTTLYEGGVRVPACIVWHGKIAPNSVSEQPMHIVDLYPTLLGIAGASLQQKHPLDGVDLKNALLENKPLEREEILLNASPQTGALLVGNWKLVLNGSVSSNSAPKGPETLKDIPQRQIKFELFDLAADPYEKNNLASAHPEKTAELFQRYLRYDKEAVPPLNVPRPGDFQPPKIWGHYLD